MRQRHASFVRASVGDEQRHRDASDLLLRWAGPWCFDLSEDNARFVAVAACARLH